MSMAGDGSFFVFALVVDLGDCPLDSGKCLATFAIFLALGAFPMASESVLWISLRKRKG